MRKDKHYGKSAEATREPDDWNSSGNRPAGLQARAPWSTFLHTLQQHQQLMSARARAQQLQNQRAQLAARVVRAVGQELIHLQRQQFELDQQIQNAFMEDQMQQQQMMMQQQQQFNSGGSWSGGGGGGGSWN